MNKITIFDRFEIQLPSEAISDCSHQGSCDDGIAYWVNKNIVFPAPELIRAELKEYGAWADYELADDAKNRERILWIAAGNIAEEEKRPGSGGSPDDGFLLAPIGDTRLLLKFLSFCV